MDYILCPNCGEKNPTGVAYCAHCGFNLKEIPGDEPRLSSHQNHQAVEEMSIISEQKKHSGLGVASFIISIVVGAMQSITIVVGGIADFSAPGGLADEIYMIIGFFICGGMAAGIIGLVLGIIGLTQKNKKRLFATLGTIINGLTFIIIIILIIIGNLV